MISIFCDFDYNYTITAIFYTGLYEKYINTKHMYQSLKIWNRQGVIITKVCVFVNCLGQSSVFKYILRTQYRRYHFHLTSHPLLYNEGGEDKV